MLWHSDMWEERSFPDWEGIRSRLEGLHESPRFGVRLQARQGFRALAFALSRGPRSRLLAPLAYAFARARIEQALLIDPALCDCYVALCLIEVKTGNYPGERFDELLEAALASARMVGSLGAHIPSRMFEFELGYGLKVEIVTPDDVRLFAACELRANGFRSRAEQLVALCADCHPRVLALKARFALEDGEAADAAMLAARARECAGGNTDLHAFALIVAGQARALLGDGQTGRETIELVFRTHPVEKQLLRAASRALKRIRDEHPLHVVEHIDDRRWLEMLRAGGFAEHELRRAG